MNDQQHPPEELESTVTEELSGQSPRSTLNRYHLLQKIGEGGMGEVWLAEQREPVRRQVAVKIIKRGMDTKQVVARFEAERQALAMMDHPCIAKVFDAGETADGRPYFVMEHIKGVPITEYSDRQRLTTRERLKLFTQVCEGAQHAHQKAIIHRDLKPSNVLVTIQGDSPVPRIIDFGVAKAVEQRLTERTLFTDLGQVIGTPEYMSPEQAEMTTQDIDTRTDVYSLGVMLYELLVGALPFDPKELRRAGFDEIRRRIREEEPSKPSTRVTTLDEASTGSARKRRTDPAGLAKLLRGDLDWITLKALEKDRTRRYSTPSEMAADIDRHLRDEAVSAGPPGGVYRLKKFYKRHKVAVLVGVLLGLGTWVGLAGLGYGIAERSFVDASRRAAELRFFARSFWLYDDDQNGDYLVSLFDASRFNEPADLVPARAIVDQAVRQLPTDIDLAGAQDAWKLSSRLTLLGRIYMNLGLYESAEPLLDRALEIRSTHLSGNRSLVLAGLENCAELHARWGREAESEEYRQRAEAYREEHTSSVRIDWADPRLDGVKRELRKLDGHYGDAYQWPVER